MRQGERFMNEGVGIFAVIVLSTIISLIVTAYTIVLAQKLLKIHDD